MCEKGTFSQIGSQLMKSYHVTCILLQSGRTALHHAAGWEQVQLIETLIKLGADVNALDKVS